MLWTLKSICALLPSLLPKVLPGRLAFVSSRQRNKPMEFWACEKTRKSLGPNCWWNVWGKLEACFETKAVVQFPLLWRNRLWNWQLVFFENEDIFPVFYSQRKLVTFQHNSFFLHLNMFTKHLRDTLRQRFLKEKFNVCNSSHIPAFTSQKQMSCPLSCLKVLNRISTELHPWP